MLTTKRRCVLTPDTVEPDAADAVDWRMRAASDVTADTPTPKHAARCNGCSVSVSGYTCSCSVAEPRLGIGRGVVIPTPSAIMLTKRLGVTKLRGMSERQQPRAKKYCKRYRRGAMDPLDPPLLMAIFQVNLG